jgi:ABC-2 type transport system ATP-binding protein
MSDVALAFDDVHRHFGGRQVLRGLDFRVAPGEVFALLGRNGAGKTTALRILLGFLAPHQGQARLLGRDSRALTPADRDRIGYVAEGHRLYDEMRIGVAVAFEAATRPRFDRKVAEHALARCGLDSKQRIGFLSRGQRAQVALLLAAAGQPDLLVFDDPAMGLDVAMRRELLDVLIELLASRGCAVLFSTHILTDVERMADRVGILHGGQLVVNARLDDLRARVQKRHWIGTNGTTVPPATPGILRARRIGSGFDLTLLDADEARLAPLRAGANLGEPVTPDLEDLFLDLTAAPEPARPGQQGALFPQDVTS